MEHQYASMEEAERLTILHEAGLMYGPRDGTVERVVRMMPRALGRPGASLGLVDAQRVWFLGSIGADLREVPRGASIEGMAIATGGAFELVDLAAEPSLWSSPQAFAGVRGWAGVPVFLRDGAIAGYLASFGPQAGKLGPNEREALEEFAALIGEHWDLANVNRELMVAREIARSAEAVRKRFFGRVGHEIRTPLNGIIGLADLLAGSHLPAPAGDWARSVAASGHLILNVVNDVLDLARLEAGQLVVQKGPMDVRKMVEEVRALFAPLAVGRSVVLRSRVSPELPEVVEGDEARTRQVMANLVANAVKHTIEGSVDIEASFGENVLVLVVSDTGVGISVSDQARLFEGTEGVGLALVRGICDQLGGTIRVSSTPGKGSVFTLRLPARALRMAPKPFVPTMTQRPLKVLVVEDHAVNQEVVRCLLERMGHEVSLASDGVEALEVLAHQAFDLVLMDMWMPRMDGLETTRVIRERYGSFMPVVALTANIEADAAEACAEAGMDDVLTKPIRMPALREVLDRVNRGWHVPLGQSA